MEPEADAVLPDAAGFVLARGRSSRMGEDEALIRRGGQPLVGHAPGILQRAGLVALIAGARSALAAMAPVAEDSKPGLGRWGGICAAQRRSSGL